MKCIIKRTSGYYEHRPCEEATREDVIYIHTRTCTEEEFNKKFSFREGLWKDNGTNHRTTNDGKWIQRDEPRTAWVADIDLIEFSKKYGELVFCYNSSDFYLPEVEIYDDYRE